MDNYTFNINNNPYEVKIISIIKNIAIIEVNGVNYDVDVSDIDELHSITQRAETAKIHHPKQTKKPSVSIPIPQPKTIKPDSGTDAVIAPMPGQVMKIHVSEGDDIKSGDVVLTIEAMKMENQIKTVGEGKITKIHVNEGDAVSEGTPLISFGG